MDRSRDERGLARRRACDHCSQRKIRCDTKKPVCSNCSNREVPCVWAQGLQSRASMSRLTPVDNSNDLQITNLQRRLESVEAQMWRNSSIDHISIDDNLVNEDLAQSCIPAGAVRVGAPRLLKTEPSVETSTCQPLAKFPLPHPEEVNRLKQFYFDILNSGMPIFSNLPSDSLNLAEGRDEHDEAVWAATNAVMALAIRHTTGKEAELFYVRNTESVLGTLLSREPDLLVLQTILCLAWYYMATEDPRPATSLMGAAVKIAYGLKLHMPCPDSPELSLRQHHERVFWITYIIDRDLSILTNEPYLIRDEHIGIDVDRMSAHEGLGVIKGDLVKIDHHQQIEVLHWRTELATIKGKLYDLVYSAKALNFTPIQKQAAERRIFRMLKDWYDFKPEPNLDQYYDPELYSPEILARQKHEFILHLDYYHCLFSVVNASIRNEAWRRTLTLFSDTYACGKDTRSIATESALLPCNWLELAEAARKCFERVLRYIPEDNDALQCISRPAFEGCVTIIAANAISISERDLSEPLLDGKGKFEHDEVEDDEARVSECLWNIERRIRYARSPSIRNDLELCHNLMNQAKETMEIFWEKAPRSFWDAKDGGISLEDLGSSP